MFTRVMRRPPGTRRRPIELSKEAEAKAVASFSATAKLVAEPEVKFATCRGCVAKKMCRQANCCMYGKKKPKEKANVKNG